MEGKVLSTLLEIANLNVFYGDQQALKNIKMDFYDHTVHAVMGPSG